MPDTSEIGSCAKLWAVDCQHSRNGRCRLQGEIGIILINFGKEDYTVADGERICQMVVKQYSHVEWEETDRLDHTKREDGGFGHTGTA